MGKREDNKIARELEQQIVDGIRERLKGSGWKKKHSSFFRKVDDKFLCASAYPYFEFKNSIPSMMLRVRYEGKPMGIDPIYWDISQMPDNKNEPLSFRAWGAFKADPAYFHLGTTIGKPAKTIDCVINTFINWMEEETERASSAMEIKSFSEIYMDLEPGADTHENHAATLICALILEGQNDQALAIARKMAPTSFRNLYLEDPNDRVNFYELTILYLAGKETFKKEVRKKPDSGFYIRKPKKLFWF